MAVFAVLGVEVLIGVVAGTLRAGGGILSVPALVYLLGRDLHDASVGSLVAVGLMVIVSLITPAWAGRVHRRGGATFGLMSVFGTPVGSCVSVVVDGTALLTLFRVMLAVVGMVTLLCGPRPRPGADDGESSGMGGAPKRRGLLVVAAATTFTGFSTGFFGVGGGLIVVLMLVLVLGFPMKKTSGASLLVMIVASLTGLATRAGTHSNVDWPVVLTFAAVLMVGGSFGGPLTKRVSAPTLTAALGIPLLGACTAITYGLLTA